MTTSMRGPLRAVSDTYDYYKIYIDRPHCSHPENSLRQGSVSPSRLAVAVHADHISYGNARSLAFLRYVAAPMPTNGSDASR